MNRWGWLLEYRLPAPFISEWERDLSGSAVEDAGYGYTVVCSLTSYFSANWLLEGLFSVYPTFALKYGDCGETVGQERYHRERRYGELPP